MVEEPTRERSIGDLLRDLSGIEREIEESRVERCVVFAEVAEYTGYVDSHGDVAGRRRLQTARAVVQQSVEDHGGRIIKSVGGGWLLLFISPHDAIQAAVGIQRDLEEIQEGGSGDRIHLKIGLDTGRLLEEPDDIFGDVVNVSGQLAERCQGGEILLSGATFKKLGPYYQCRCVSITALTLRGKQETAIGYRLEWCQGARPSQGIAPEKGMVAEVHWNGAESRVSLYEIPDSGSTVQPSETHPLDLDQIHALSSQINLTIKKANLEGALRQASIELEIQGKQLFDLLFPEEIRKKIQQLRAESLILQLDEACVHIPWEMAHDGHDFLCCRFAVGRMVRTGQPLRQPVRQKPEEILSFFILSDPCGNLSAAAREGRDLYDMSRNDLRVDAEWLNGRVLAKEVNSRLTRYDVIHYCGHAEHEFASPERSGWLLPDGRLSAGSLRSYAERDEPLPLLVFNHACHGSTMLAWDEDCSNWSQGLANAFLMAGCHHYIGAVSELLDTGSNEFAKVFYRSLLAGYSVGRSLRHARMAFRSSPSTHSLTWAQYVLYGDPGDGVFALPEMASSDEAALLEPRDPPAPVPQRKRRFSKAATASIFIGIPIFLFAFYWFIPASYLGGRFGPVGSTTADTRVDGNGTASLQTASGMDHWTSQPLLTAVLPLDDPARSGQSKVPINMLGLEERIESAFLERGFRIASRERLLEALQELRMGIPDVTGPAASAKLAKRLGTRFLVASKLYQKNGVPYLGLQILDTGEGMLTGTVVEAIGTASGESILRAARSAIKTIEKKCPLQGKVTNAGPEGVMLNIGAGMGVRMGDTFEVFPPAPDPQHEDVLMPKEPVTTLAVEAVEEQVCRVSPPAAGVSLEVGMRVRRKGQ